MPRYAALLLTIGIAAAPAGAGSAASGTVTVYRCTAANGHVTLRDSPCRAGERQEVRTMARPTDPAPRATVATTRVAPAPSVATATSPVPSVVYRTAPRPLYECTTPDGEVYTSENPEGNPRWVPLWTVGYPIVVGLPPRVTPHRGGIVVQRPGSTVIAGGPGVYPPVAYPTVPGGTWIRDVCHALPAAEMCAQLRDRRDALDRRWYSALQGDRDAIEREQRSLDARLAEECE